MQRPGLGARLQRSRSVLDLRRSGRGEVANVSRDWLAIYALTLSFIAFLTVMLWVLGEYVQATQ